MSATAAAYSCPEHRLDADAWRSASYPRHLARGEAKPASPVQPAGAHACPFCEQPLPIARTSIVSMFAGGLKRFLVAIGMILGAVLRTVRLVVASALALIGLLGYCSRQLAYRVAHRDDRRLLGFKSECVGS